MDQDFMNSIHYSLSEIARGFNDLADRVDELEESIRSLEHTMDELDEWIKENHGPEDT